MYLYISIGCTSALFYSNGKSSLLRLFGHKATSGKGFKNPVLPTYYSHHRSNFFVRINLVNNKRSNKFPFLFIHNPLIFITILLQQQKLQRLLLFFQNTQRKPIGYVWRTPPAWRNSSAIWNQRSYPEINHGNQRSFCRQRSSTRFEYFNSECKGQHLQQWGKIFALLKRLLDKSALIREYP